MCKPHEANGSKGSLNSQTRQEKEARLREKEQKQDLRDDS